MKFAYFGAVFLIFTTGLILILSHPKNKSIRWASATAFCSTFEAGNLLITKFIDPGAFWQHKDLFDSSMNLSGVFNTIAYFFFPYCFLMFSINYTQNFIKRPGNFQKIVGLATLLPIIMMYILFPVTDFIRFNPYRISHTIMALWGTPYLISGNILFLYSYFKAKNNKEKNEIFHVSVFVLPTMTIVAVISYLLVGLGNTELFEYRIIALIYAFVIFIFYILREGLLGIRLRFEKYRLDSVMQAFSSGTSLLNHAVKNEILNISLSASMASQSEAAQKDPALNKSLNRILNAAQNMISLVTRFNENIKDINLNESPNNLIDLVEQSLLDLDAYISAKEIRISRDYSDCTPILMCDPVHMLGVIYNIIKNAVEAMKQEGNINIQIYTNHSRLILAINDNGIGISKENLPRVIEPFFSTKNLNYNFGLGLSYCYNVMRKSGGSLEIHSEENIGTTVFLSFSPKKFLSHCKISNNKLP